MQVTGKKEPYLNFLRELVIKMLTKHGKSPKKKCQVTLQHDKELSWEQHHWPVHSDLNKKGNFRMLNCKFCYSVHKKEKKTSYMCDKCGVALHVECMKEIAFLKFIPYSLLIMYHCKVVIVSHTSSALLIGKSRWDTTNSCQSIEHLMCGILLLLYSGTI